MGSDRQTEIWCIIVRLTQYDLMGRQGVGQVDQSVQQQPHAGDQSESGHQPGRRFRRRILPVRSVQRRRQQHQRRHRSPGPP